MPAYQIPQLDKLLHGARPLNEQRHAYLSVHQNMDPIHDPRCLGKRPSRAADSIIQAAEKSHE